MDNLKVTIREGAQWTVNFASTPYEINAMPTNAFTTTSTAGTPLQAAPGQIIPTPPEPTAPEPTAPESFFHDGALVKSGERIIGIRFSMHHYLCPGRIDKLRNPKEVWIHWSDSTRTHTDIDGLAHITDKECPEPTPLSCPTCSAPCIWEKDRRSSLSKQEKKAIKIGQRKHYLSPDLHTFFMQELTEFHRQANNSQKYPFMYLIGRRGDGLMVEAEILRGTGGCHDMQFISTYELVRAQTKMLQNKRIPVGIGRVGDFYYLNNEGIEEISQMTNGQGIILNINKEKIWVTLAYSGIKIRCEVVIAKSRYNKVKKGGEEHGKKEEGSNDQTQEKQ